PAAPLARPSEPVVSSGRLLPPPWFWRLPGQVSRRSALETDARPAPGRRRPIGAPAGGRWGRLLDHVAAGRRRAVGAITAGTFQPPETSPSARQGQGGRQARRQRIGRDVAGGRQPGAARPQAKRPAGPDLAQTVTPQPGADVRLLGADAP